MALEHEDEMEVRVAEIERLIKDFKQTFKERTSSAENFITMNEIEAMWGDLRQGTNNIYSDMVREMLKEVDEGDLIRKKKREYREKGIKLRTDKIDERTILTLNGKLPYSRYILRPLTSQDKEKLLNEHGVKSIAPMDCYLGLASVPFKMTVAMMLKIAYWAQNQCSYRAAEKAISTIYGVFVNDSTVRHVTSFPGDYSYEFAVGG
jgi:hypothetical protein